MFADKFDYDSLASFQFIKAISISGDNVSVNLTLFINSSDVQLEYNGKMYKSFRYTDKKPVYIGVFEDDCTVVSEDSEEINELTNFLS